MPLPKKMSAPAGIKFLIAFALIVLCAPPCASAQEKKKAAQPAKPETLTTVEEAARLGLRTCLLSMNADAVAQMSCNPAIGGVAKGQIVREIDALGGVMGKCIDASGIQFRILNASKGPAMHSPRAQADKKLYQFTMKRWVEEQPNLTLRQELVEGLLLEEPPDSHSSAAKRAVMPNMSLYGK